MSRAASRDGMTAGAAILIFYLLLPHLLLSLLPRGPVSASAVCIFQPLGALLLAAALRRPQGLPRILKAPLPNRSVFFWLAMLPGLLVCLALAASGWEKLLEAFGIPLAPPASELLIAKAPPLLYGCFAVSAIFLAPVAEEVLFRDLLYRGLRTVASPWIAAVLSAMLFGALHFTLRQFLPLMVMGLLLQWLFLYTRSLKAAILLHTLNNLVSFVMLSLAFRW